MNRQSLLSNITFIGLLILFPFAGKSQHNLNSQCANLTDSSGNKIGMWVYENSKGKLDSMINYKNGHKNGVCYLYNLGKLFKSITYANDTLNGVLTLYDFNGYPILIETYKANKLNGLLLSFYEEDNQIKTAIFFKDGLYDGEFKAYFRNGNLQIQQSFKNGSLEGIETMYWENGNIKILTNYTNGIIQGERQYYAETGKIYKQEKYNKGILIETVNYN